jgi:hypothetical protein
MGTDYYKLLGIDKSANEAEIKSAYKKMVRPTCRNASIELISNTGIKMASRPQRWVGRVLQEV